MPRVGWSRADSVCRVPKPTSRSTVARSRASETWSAIVRSGVARRRRLLGGRGGGEQERACVMASTDTPFAPDWKRLIEPRPALVEARATARRGPISRVA